MTWIRRGLILVAALLLAVAAYAIANALRTTRPVGFLPANTMHELLRDPRVRRLLIANTLGAIGSGITIFAVPWLLVQRPGDDLGPPVVAILA